MTCSLAWLVAGCNKLGGGKTGKKVSVTAKLFWVRYFIVTVTEHFFLAITERSL